MSLLDADWFDAEKVPTYKLGLHLAQILLAFVVWVLEIVVFRSSDATINGNNGWTFAAVFLSIPAWVYLVMAPRYPRTQKIATPTVMLVVDTMFTVIWLSAFATQAAYNTANSCGSVCTVSKAIVGLAFFVFVFFASSTFLSLYTLKYWEQNTALPGYDGVASRRNRPMAAADIDPHKEAFSTAPHDEESVYAPLGMNDHNDHDGTNDARTDLYGAPSPYGGAGGLHADPYGEHPAASQASYGGGSSVGGAENPFRQDNPFEAEGDNGYHSGQGSTVSSRYNAPTAHDDNDGNVSFPTANYDRIGIERYGASS